MNVAIIGAGNVGSAVGGSLLRAGHAVTYASRGDGAARAAARGGTAAASAAEAVGAADLVVIAVPWPAAAGVAAEIASVARGKVVIDATNPLAPDGGLATASGPSGAEQLAALLPGARVAKALNTLFAAIQGDPAAYGITLDALYATDDARSEVADLLVSIGFRPVHVGPLARARELEAMAYLNIQLQLLHAGAWRTTFALLGAPEAAVVTR
jgi:8-hydroxy-5-deazaflavin:NADPH oxidoreductase